MDLSYFFCLWRERNNARHSEEQINIVFISFKLYENMSDEYKSIAVDTDDSCSEAISLFLREPSSSSSVVSQAGQGEDRGCINSSLHGWCSMDRLAWTPGQDQFANSYCLDTLLQWQDIAGHEIWRSHPSDQAEGIQTNDFDFSNSDRYCPEDALEKGRSALCPAFQGRTRSELTVVFVSVHGHAFRVVALASWACTGFLNLGRGLGEHEGSVHHSPDPTKSQKDRSTRRHVWARNPTSQTSWHVRAGERYFKIIQEDNSCPENIYMYLYIYIYYNCDGGVSVSVEIKIVLILQVAFSVIVLFIYLFITYDIYRSKMG